MSDPGLQQEAESIGERLDRIETDFYDITQQLRNLRLACAAIARFGQLSPRERREKVEAFKAEMVSLGFYA